MGSVECGDSVLYAHALPPRIVVCHYDIARGHNCRVGNQLSIGIGGGHNCPGDGRPHRIDIAYELAFGEIVSLKYFAADDKHVSLA